MRRLWLVMLGLGAYGSACGGTAAPPAGEGSSSGGSTAATTEAADGTTTGTTGESCSPAPAQDAGYDACPGACGDGQCLHEEGAYGVCTRGCVSDCDCWPAPETGTAPARCSTTVLEALPICVLDCSMGATCPSEMICLPDLEICAHPAPSTGDGSSGTTDGGSGTMSGGSTGTIPPD